MLDDVKPLLDRVCELIAERVDARRIAAAKRRHADMLAWRESDYIPILFGRRVAEAAEMPAFDWARQWHDPAASLYMQLKDNVLPRVAAGCDYVPGVRADTGVINCMTIFGAAFDVPAHTKPVVTRYVAKERLREFRVPRDVSQLGIMPHVVRHMAHHLSALDERGLGGLICVYHCDQQGPFDIAAQTRGHDLFTDLYDDPEFVHELMGKAVEAYVAVSRLCKRLAGQAPDAGNAVGYYLARGLQSRCIGIGASTAACGCAATAISWSGRTPSQSSSCPTSSRPSSPSAAAGCTTAAAGPAPGGWRASTCTSCTPGSRASAA